MNLSVVGHDLRKPLRISPTPLVGTHAMAFSTGTVPTIAQPFVAVELIQGLPFAADAANFGRGRSEFRQDPTPIIGRRPWRWHSEIFRPVGLVVGKGHLTVRFGMANFERRRRRRRDNLAAQMFLMI